MKLNQNHQYLKNGKPGDLERYNRSSKRNYCFHFSAVYAKPSHDCYGLKKSYQKVLDKFVKDILLDIFSQIVSTKMADVSRQISFFANP